MRVFAALAGIVVGLLFVKTLCEWGRSDQSNQDCDFEERMRARYYEGLDEDYDDCR